MKEQADHWDRLSVHPPDASVIDPGDRSGRKNRYIASVRDESILESLNGIRADSVVLDFGCGTGSLTRALVASGRHVLGVDISAGLLQRTPERALGDSALFVRYDGTRLPVADASVGVVTTYVVLNHVIDDDALVAILRELHRVLVPGGRLVAIEQVRTRRTIDKSAWQHRRTFGDFLSHFTAAGFESVSADIVRYGRLPSTYALRYGLLPESWTPSLRRFELRLGTWLGIVAWDYCDVRFVVQKR